MCTLAFEFNPGSAVPLVVAANRDELKTRPSTGLKVWSKPLIVAPRDEIEGGTWLGVNGHGLFVGITNRFQSAKHPERTSRGQLVLEALAQPSAEGLHHWLTQLKHGQFNDFHLAYADAERAFITWSADDVISHRELSPGLHVVTERSFQQSTVAREALVRTSWPAKAAEHTATLQQLLRTKAEPSFDGLTVNLPEFNYGTRSSFILVREQELLKSRCWFADGAPDVTAFVDRSDQLRTLFSLASKI